ncbi:dipeptide/oligopeptide/nickel ABC transporter permease/ATP-binding protein [Aestuariimicrobium sp. p3-SID1156]|uniref:dipeptide/oligopeptide/nickel ABC transporter permease/ATP-binding protein n=1 Tax=Aestuariimicrobium sp. p3-SID1156 TaxID=2916038 RepID=UPI00223AEB65|nr:dipeptide/oligopeptide/nickel ABC transporter permease/ATP-binding protein [Aestuariimicrobium sp. p3-SID1156]MCT1460242.1 dipeptide/oligopeptide/nickel ABC transporter permease/ATP-binding protein [Aestuariimicrobium sp. p3-SID1156]
MRRKLSTRLSSVQGGRLDSLRRLPWTSRIAVGFLLLMVLAALLAPLLSRFDPLATGLSTDPSIVGTVSQEAMQSPAVAPNGTFWFGTDASGRDIFSRVLHGARSSLLIGLCATGAALLVAAVLGSIAATAHKWVSEVLMRLLDIIMSFPGIALAVVFVAVFGTSLPVIILAIGFLYVPQLARVIRANVISQFGEDYVAASKVMGASTPWILIRHVARNCLAPIMVFATVLVADAIVFEASLSFINAGVKPPNPSWGNILAEGKQLLISGLWWPTFFPGLMILLTVLALNVLSEGLTDALASPTIRRKVDVEADEKAMLVDPVAATEEALDDQVLSPAQGERPAGILPQDAEETAPELQATGVLGLTDQATATRLLNESLQSLRVHESARTDRLVLADQDAAPLLQVKDLRIAFPQAHGEVDIVDNVSFDVRPGETMGLVGESGCGKSITSMAVMGLLPRTARIQGEILFEGRDLLTMGPRERNALRGHEMAMVYQDALSSLNPSMLIRTQLNQLLRRGGTRSAEELLELVGLDPKRMLASYPHELSGGQRQRVLIAMALTRNPRLVMADEPTTALDVTVQRQVVDLLRRLQDELGFAMVFVSHDLALVAQLAHRITVMYAGQVVEQATTTELLIDPRHEYTRGLLGSVLSIESGASRLHQVPGTVPAPRDFVKGDRFAPRSSRPEVGLDIRPQMVRIPGTSHWVATTTAEGGLR